LALLEKAAGQGHAYAMQWLGTIYCARGECEQAVEWYTMGAEAGLPQAMLKLGRLLEDGNGVAAPDSAAAAGWYRRAANAGVGDAAKNLSHMYALGRGRAWQIMLAALYPSFLELNSITRRANIIGQALGRGVTRSKQMVMRWLRKAAENGDTDSCVIVATRMYLDMPYARDVGHVVEAAGVASSAGIMEGHDVPSDVLSGVVHWLRKGGHDPVQKLDVYRRAALKGGHYCFNDGCEVVGQLKDFKVCPQCKTARYCGDACQKQDWTTGGHKATCGTFASRGGENRAPA